MGQDIRFPSVIVMTAGGANPQVMINAIKKRWPDLHVIEEQPESKKTILLRRAKRLGWLTAVGQLGTMIVSRLGKNIATRRSEDILTTYGQSAAVDPSIPIHHVESLNGIACHVLIAQLRPQVIFTISCRLLSKETLAACPCPIINFHAGINPTYRGQMGGYWALVEDDRENFGATVHLVDAGTDTGGTLYERRVTPGKADFIATYPILMTSASTDIAIEAIGNVLSGNIAARQQCGRSALRFPPPIWTWLWNGLTKGIW